MNVPTNKFKAGLQRGDLQIGLWSSLCSNIAAEIISHSGFDWILLDTEHAPNEPHMLIAQMQAMVLGTAAPVVRPAWNDMVLIKRILDSGAQSILVPFVGTKDEAEAAVSYARFPPDGVRGAMGASRAASFGRIKNYLTTANAEIAVIAQAETIDAVNNIEEIAAVDGIDAVFIGPSDLSASMGHVNNPSHPEVQAVMKRGFEAIVKSGKPAGTLAYDPNDARRYIDWGVTFVAVGSDASVLLRGTAALAQSFKS